jgi:hypothetical protein
VKTSALLAVLLGLLMSFGLSACLSSDAPNLSTEDLLEPAGFAGPYVASAFPDDPSDGPNAISASVEPIGERTYRLTFFEGERKDAPVLLRLLKLNDGTVLGVVTDPDPSKGALYTIATHAANGSWVFRNVDFKLDRRDRKLSDALTRHGATAVSFGNGGNAHNQIKGSLTAANLRALFSDPDFSGTLTMESGFRLSPMTASATTNALE